MDGKGVFKFANGDTYEGEFQDGKKTGRGTMKFWNKIIFEGKYNKNGTKKGT